MASLKSSREIKIAVMGATGSGKSTFIKASGSDLPVGRGLESCTSEVRTSRPFMVSECLVTLIDTPGFDDTFRSDTEVLSMIAAYLSTTYEHGARLAGVIYMHRISDPRMGGTSKRNFKTFRELCGESSLRSVLIVTNRWREVTPEIGEARESELANNKRFFKPVLEKGARMLRHDATVESAHTIIRYLINNHPTTLRIQQEIVNEHKPIEQTAAGAELLRALNELADRHKKEILSLREEMEAAIRAKDEEMRTELQEELEKKHQECLRIEQNSRRMAAEFAAERARLEAHIQQMEEERERLAALEAEKQRQSAAIAAAEVERAHEEERERARLQEEFAKKEKELEEVRAAHARKEAESTEAKQAEENARKRLLELKELARQREEELIRALREMEDAHATREHEAVLARKAEEEERARWLVEQHEAKLREEEAQRKRVEDELLRTRRELEEAEERRKQQEAADAKRLEEETKSRLLEQEKLAKQREEEQRKIAEEEVARALKELEEEQARKEREAAIARAAEELERTRLLEEQKASISEQARQKEEAEREERQRQAAKEDCEGRLVDNHDSPQPNLRFPFVVWKAATTWVYRK